MRIFEQAKTLFLGTEKSIKEPHIFHKLALIAFFGWVGLGADGLSSANYGPQEAFLALGTHKHLALYLAFLTAITVFTISASYFQIIELFPSGGGGYVVATKLLNPAFGLISGCALLVDYILTISISISSGIDAIFSFLPLGFLKFKLEAVLLVTIILIILNLRGVKESVAVLTPIFLLFFISHTLIIIYGIFTHFSITPTILFDTIKETKTDIQQLGFFTMALILLRAFSLGGGTYTGIEAVSNGLQMLREPKVKTGKKTMLYMATSLAFTAGGLLICYLLTDLSWTPGKTLNASLIEKLIGTWEIGDFPVGMWLLGIILISEGAILFVAAQTGFLDGPRVLGNMAIDSWVPNRFMHISERLVVQNGILFMGICSLLIIFFTKGSVQLLVVMYSINVFLTFSLSQIGMCIHWLKNKGEKWVKKFSINAFGLILSLSILISTTLIKFHEGGWATLVITFFFIMLSLLTKRHYLSVIKAMRRLDDIMMQVSEMTSGHQVPPKDPNAPTAVVLVRGFDGLGVHTFLSVHRTFPYHFKNFVFISVGVVDWRNFKGAKEIENLETYTKNELTKYVRLANKFGFYAESVSSISVNVLDELESLCCDVKKRFNKVVIFMGKLIFERENLLTRFLHNQTSLALQRRLQFKGIPTVILPIRVLRPPKKTAVKRKSAPEDNE